MKDNRFDDIVRSKLSDLKSDSTPKWSQFLEKKKVADNIEADMYFDKNIRNSISKYRVDFNADHWTLLKERINYLSSLKKKVNGLKSMELAALFVLLFISFSKFNHNSASLTNDQFVESNVKNDSYAHTNQMGFVNVNTTNEIAKTAEVNNSNHVKSNKEKETLNNTRSDNNLSSKSIFVPAVTINSNFVFAEDSNKNTDISFDNSIDIINENSVKNKKLLALLLADENELTSSEKLLPLVNNSSKHVSSIKSIESKLLTIERSRPVIENSFGIVPFQTNSSWLHLVASFDNNMIFTPDDLAYNTTARKTEMFGFTFGVLYSRLIGKWEIETGLTTSTYSKPWDFTQQYGNFSGWYQYSLTNIENNFVGIPMQAKYHFVQNNEWSIFVKTGLTSEFIVNTEYTSENAYLGGVPVPIGTNPEPQEVVSPFEEDHNFSEGLFQGGSIKDNLFVRAQLGLGIERSVSSNTSIYFSGDYHMSIINNHLGPNNDRINKLGFNVGVKTLIR